MGKRKKKRYKNKIDNNNNRSVQSYGVKKTNAVNSGYSHSGASRKNNSFIGWEYSSHSAIEDINDNLDLLRQRSRSLYMGGGLGTASIKIMRSNIVGSGLKLKPNIDFEALGISGGEAREWSKEVEREFNIWASSKECDYFNLNNFYELQSIAIMGVLQNGDSIALAHYENEINSDFDLKIQVIESDRLCNPGIDSYSSSSVQHLRNGNRIISGIEVDKRGKPVAFWICNRHPAPRFNFYDGDSVSWNRITINNSYTGLPNVLFSFDPERAEQYRGVPFLAPIIELMKNIERYTEAEVKASLINALFCVFIENSADPFSMHFQTSIAEEDSVLSPEERALNYELGAGTINVLGKNEKVVFSDPKRPTNSFEAFLNQIAKLIGASLEIPFEVLMKSFNSSYSASRASLLEAWKLFRQKREWFINEFCRPIYELWLFEAVSKGKIKAKNYFKNRSYMKLWSSATWIGMAQGQIDPVKEVQAAQLRIKNGFSTREKETQELTGMDFESNLRVLERENKELAKINEFLSEESLKIKRPEILNKKEGVSE